MDWTAQINAYCERLGPGLWAEPLNAVTNLAFVIAAVVAWRAARMAGKLDALYATLCMLAFAIGVGSFLLHTFAQRWASIADVVPILLFIILYIAATANRLFGLRWLYAIPATIVAFALALTARKAVLIAAGGPFYGAEGYAPAFALIAGTAVLLKLRKHPAAPMIGLAALIFLASLTARSIDSLLCDAIPLGTHFLWHILNGTVLGVLLLALLRYGAPQTRQGNNTTP